MDPRELMGVTMLSIEARESRVRRALARQGQRLWKVRRGRDQWEYGPYATIDASTTAIVLRGVTLEDIEAGVSAEMA